MPIYLYEMPIGSINIPLRPIGACISSGAHGEQQEKAREAARGDQPLEHRLHPLLLRRQVLPRAIRLLQMGNITYMKA